MTYCGRRCWFPSNTRPALVSTWSSWFWSRFTEYANRDQTAWPGAWTLADDVTGLHRRDVTNALEVLEMLNGLIAWDGKRGRAIVWRFVITDVDVSRPPDTLPVDNREAADNNMSRIPDTSEGNVSRDLSGNVSCDVSGGPDSKRKRRITPYPPRGWDINKHHDYAVRALTTLITERRLPATPDRLMSDAYRLGNGDPWDGYLKIKTRTEHRVDGAAAPAAVLAKRLDR